MFARRIFLWKCRYYSEYVNKMASRVALGIKARHYGRPDESLNLILGKVTC